MACIQNQTRAGIDNMRRHISNRTDADVVRAITRACHTSEWYHHKNSYHRWFLRQLIQEAHKRSLEVPKFEWPKGGVA